MGIWVYLSFSFEDVRSYFTDKLIQTVYLGQRDRV